MLNTKTNENNVRNICFNDMCLQSHTHGTYLKNSAIAKKHKKNTNTVHMVVHTFSIECLKIKHKKYQ